MSEWAYIENYLIADPEQILPNTKTPVWWRCSKDNSHIYLMSPAKRLQMSILK